MAKDRIVLSSIVLTTSEGQEVKLTVAEARALHAQLEELFGERVRYLPSQPIIIERDRWPNPWRPYRPFWYGPGEPLADLTPRSRWSGSGGGATTAGVSLTDQSSGLRVRYEG